MRASALRVDDARSCRPRSTPFAICVKTTKAKAFSKNTTTHCFVVRSVAFVVGVVGVVVRVHTRSRQERRDVLHRLAELPRDGRCVILITALVAHPRRPFPDDSRSPATRITYHVSRITHHTPRITHHRSPFPSHPGDVSAEAGVSIAEASNALSALALDAKATLSVSPAGEILYEFPRNFKEVIAAKSFRIRVEPLLKKASLAAAYLGRVAFGSALLVSIATVALSLSVLSSKSSDSRDSRYNSGPRFYFSMFDFWWYFDPYYYRRRRAVDPDSMGFLESVYSCVFGDGDPNEEDFEQSRWNALGRYIQSRGGVATAEELAPFLDASTREFGAVTDADGLVVQESFVLPALTRFGGEPRVDAAGNIVYVFESLQSTAAPRPMPVPYDAVLEREWQLTRATTPQKILVGLLAAANLVGIIALSVSLQNPRNIYILTVNGLQGVVGMMPFLQAYALSFVVIPLVRWAGIRRKNEAIVDRNEARMRAAESLLRPGPTLKDKLVESVKYARSVLVRKEDAVFRSDAVGGGGGKDDAGDEFAAWDRRFSDARKQQ